MQKFIVCLLLGVLLRIISPLYPGQKDLSVLVEYFDRFSEPADIKEILTNHVTSGMPEVEVQCLELLQKYDPEFIADWRARKTTDNNDA